MHRSLLIANLLWMTASAAQETPMDLPELVPSALAVQWLAQDPTVQGAEGEYAAAKAEAAQVEASPYEWTTTATYQQRNYGHGSNSDEWNVGIERQVRLPKKLTADRAIAAATIAAAKARLSLARRQAAQDLLNLWLDWFQAVAMKNLLLQQQALVEESLVVVAKRVHSGDAAGLEQRLAEAEVTEIQRTASTAATLEAIAWEKFSARFPTAGLQPRALPLPRPVMFDAAWWLEHISAVSDQLVAAEADQTKAEASAERAKADRTPDPTFGVFTGSEAHGDEMLVGGTVSFPFPGERRTQQLHQQLAQVDVARARVESTRRELISRARVAFAGATGDYTRWRLAQSATEAMNDNARIAQKAYTLGEQDLQTLLMARRQSLITAEAEQQSRADALRMAYLLALDAKMLWLDP